MSSGVVRPSAARTSSSQRPSRPARKWQSDEAYVEAQNKDSSWNHETPWGEASASKFVEYGRVLMATGRLFHNDRVVDFGGNDGYAANEFYKALAIKPTVIDCEPRRLEWAAQVYKLPTLHAFLEDLHAVDDKYFDWAYCSHTMEHMREPGGALREMARVTKYGCLFILPIEDPEHQEHNEAHAFQLNSAKEWKALIDSNGWRCVRSQRPIRQETHIMAEPREFLT